MLTFLGTNAADRKLRAFVAACFRRQWHELDNSEVRPTEALERYLIGQITFSEMDDLYRQSGQFGDNGAAAQVDVERAFAEIDFVDYFVEDMDEESAARADLVRDIFGNPFWPVSVDPAWLTANGGIVPRLAREAYENRQLPAGHLDTDRLAVLADALEEAGCADDRILSHLRGPGPHVLGCWAVDLLLAQ